MGKLNPWLITGGAGYIGAHIVRDFLKNNIEIVVIDDLSTGQKRKIPGDVVFYPSSILDKDILNQIFLNHEFEGVIHVAAKKSVIDSMTRPNYYFEENVMGLKNILDVMKTRNVNKLVFSSSSSVYGSPSNALSKESDLLNPISFYGKTKLIGEWLIDGAVEWGLNSICLRYFNVAGAGSVGLGDVGEFNLIPMVFRAIVEKRNPVIFGNNYPTHDGTCIRDYIHVDDVSSAHLTCAQKLMSEPLQDIFNIGTGHGYSVKEVIEKIMQVTKLNFDVDIAPPRAGDPATTGADTKKIKTILGWESKKGIDEIIDSAWQAWQFRAAKK